MMETHVLWTITAPRSFASEIPSALIALKMTWTRMAIRSRGVTATTRTRPSILGSKSFARTVWTITVTVRSTRIAAWFASSRDVAVRFVPRKKWPPIASGYQSMSAWSTRVAGSLVKMVSVGGRRRLNTSNVLRGFASQDRRSVTAWTTTATVTSMRDVTSV